MAFVSEPIEVQFDEQPDMEKKPGCPDRFVWQGEEHEIIKLLSEWHDYGRKGRMAYNMRPEHAATATQRGSWGVGRDYYRVLTQQGRRFEIYYDRAPRYSHQRKGGWFLYRELPSDEAD